ncbi:MAG: DUF4142 domain-containing protein [Pseudomonadota bacterium]
MKVSNSLRFATASILFVAYSLSAYGQTSPQPTPAQNSADTTQAATDLKHRDKKFIEEAAHNGLAEVELGKLAATKASSDDVKKFAQQMVDDHTKANAELQQVAQSKGVTLPTTPDASHQRTLKKMQDLSGPDFDKRYLSEAGVKDHRANQKLFKDQATKGQDPDLKAFAQKTLPVITHHLQMAQNMADTHNKATTQ